MNEENKNPELNGEENLSDQELNEELESLRDTFQEKYDESVEEANAEPVIQELEEGEPEEEPEEEEAEEESEEAVPEKAPKKKKKTKKIIAVTIPVVVLILIVGALLAYVVASMTNPNFSSFISAYAQASSAEKYEDKISYLESALDYCSDKESVFQQAMAATILEEIVVATYNEKGFSAAYSYMKSNMSEQQIANPVSSDFKKIVNVLDDINAFALSSFEKVIENIGDSTEAPEAEALSSGLKVPADIKETADEILKSFAEGIIFNKKAESLTDSLTAMNYYANAYSGFTSLGADEREVAEKLAVVLYNNGFIVEAVSFASVAIDPEKEAVNSDYSKMKEEIAVFADYKLSVLDIAEKAVADNKTDADSLLSAVKDGVQNISDENAAIVASFIDYAIEGIEAENAHNLTEASSCYATLTSVLDAFGMADVSVHLKTAKTIFDCGNLSDANTLVTTYLTDEKMADATEEQKTVRDNMLKVFEALNAASEVFSPYYAEYYQYGTLMDYEEVSSALNELITEDADNYLKGFVNYCLYFAAVSSEGEVDTLPIINAMAENMPELVFVYGYYYIDEYLSNKQYSLARNYAEKLLEVNVADEYANSIIALTDRVNGDLDASIESALKGIELSGSSSYCGKHLAIAYMLKGDFESAFGYITSLYANNMSVDSCDLVLIFNKLYDGENEEIKTALESAVSEVNQTYSYYGVTSYDDTLAILDGSKTLEDVFMGGNYDISD